MSLSFASTEESLDEHRAINCSLLCKEEKEVIPRSVYELFNRFLERMCVESEIIKRELYPNFREKRKGGKIGNRSKKHAPPR